MMAVILVLVVLVGTSVLAVEISTRLAEWWIALNMKLHEEYGLAWPTLNTPLSAMFIFHILSRLQLNYRLVISLVAAYPTSYIAWIAPNVYVILLLLTLCYFILV